MSYTMNHAYEKKEIQEAIEAGYRAIDAIKAAERSLGVAKGLGIWDIFGGGFIASFFKHAKMDEAQHRMEDARFELERFRKELGDVQMSLNIDLRSDTFSRVADMFFDNFIFDAMVQSQINDNAKQLANARRQVEETVLRLENIAMTL